MSETRFERQERFFGLEGQQRLLETTVTIVGCGGLGAHVAQQLAYLGIRRFYLIDKDQVARTNLNRLVGAVASDIGFYKTDVIERVIKTISPDAVVEKIKESMISEAGYQAIQAGDFVFGCVDRDGVRLLLSKVCSAYKRPYFDLATEIDPEASPINYGGRIFFAKDDGACLSCTDELDPNEIREDLMSPEQRAIHEKTYGIERDVLGGSGPSVVSLNGVIASLAVTEFMVELTGVRPANQLLTYRAQAGFVTKGKTEGKPDCLTCSLWGKGTVAATEKYISQGIGNFL